MKHNTVEEISYICKNNSTYYIYYDDFGDIYMDGSNTVIDNHYAPLLADYEALKASNNDLLDAIEHLSVDVLASGFNEYCKSYRNMQVAFTNAKKLNDDK